jgi:hypothetical protein
MPEVTNHMDQSQSAALPRPALQTGIQCWSGSPDPFKSAGFGVDINRRGTARSLARDALGPKVAAQIELRTDARVWP